MSDMGLSIAASGLAASTAELDTASNNLANITTPGYATEQVNLSSEIAAGPLGAGQGVVVGSVSQLTDAVYGAASVAALAVQGAAIQTNNVMTTIESIFPEPSNSGIASQLNAFWSNLSSLATNPADVGAEQAVVGAAQSVSSSISGSFTQLSQLSSSLQSNVGSGAGDGGTLAQVNTLLHQVASLNAGIVAGTVSGQNANALIDQDTADVNTLAGLLGVTMSTAADGSATVYLNGVQLVAGDVAQTLSASGSAATSNLSISTAYGVTIQPGGSIGANLTAVNSTIPDYQQQLNTLADSLATSVNALQANGLDAHGDPGSAVGGTGTGTVLPNVFVNGGSASTYTSSSAGFNSASTISVSAALLANPTQVATAAAPRAGNSNVVGTPTLDGTNAQLMASLASSGTGPNSLYQSLIGALGTQASNALTASTVATTHATTASNNLSSTSGVNENTQEVEILQAQNAFQANSKVVSAITSCFQSLLQAV